LRCGRETCALPLSAIGMALAALSTWVTVQHAEEDSGGSAGGLSSSSEFLDIAVWRWSWAGCGTVLALPVARACVSGSGLGLPIQDLDIRLRSRHHSRTFPSRPQTSTQTGHESWWNVVNGDPCRCFWTLRFVVRRCVIEPTLRPGGIVAASRCLIHTARAAGQWPRGCE
jgi:hypothetical protein